MNQDNSGGGGVGFSDAGVLALLADTNRAGRGGGYWGGEGGGYGGPFATPSANAVRINRNSAQLADEARHTDTNRICDRMMDGFGSITQGLFASEMRNGDRLRDVEREMSANAREAANCCCDIQKQQIGDTAALSRQIAEVESRLSLNQCKDTAAIIAEVKASEGRDVERSLNAANAELTALKTQIACGCCPPKHHGGHGHP